MLLHKKIVFFLGLFLCAVIPVQAATMDSLIELLSFKQYSADFQQKTMDQKESLLQQLEGVIIFEKPNKFYWQSQEPFPQELVGNGKLIWHFDADLEQVLVQDYAKQVDTTPMLLLLQNTAALKENFSLLQSKVEGNQQFFSLQMHDKQSNVERIDIGFTDKKLSYLLFVDQLKQTTRIRFSNIQLDQPVAADKFEFVIPEDADVLYE